LRLAVSDAWPVLALVDRDRNARIVEELDHLCLHPALGEADSELALFRFIVVHCHLLFPSWEKRNRLLSGAGSSEIYINEKAGPTEPASVSDLPVGSTPAPHYGSKRQSRNDDGEQTLFRHTP